MAFIMLVVAFLVGEQAFHNLDRPHPTPGAWFEGAVTLALILGAVLLLVIHGDDE